MKRRRHPWRHMHKSYSYNHSRSDGCNSVYLVDQDRPDPTEDAKVAETQNGYMWSCQCGLRWCSGVITPLISVRSSLRRPERRDPRPVEAPGIIRSITAFERRLTNTVTSRRVQMANCSRTFVGLLTPESGRAGELAGGLVGSRVTRQVVHQTSLAVQKVSANRSLSKFAMTDDQLGRQIPRSLASYLAILGETRQDRRASSLEPSLPLIEIYDLEADIVPRPEPRPRSL
jgi:hypothetical protein